MIYNIHQTLDLYWWVTKIVSLGVLNYGQANNTPLDILLVPFFLSIQQIEVQK